MKKILILAVMLLAPYAMMFAQTGELKIGDEAPEIRLPDMKGDTVTLSSMKNKLVLIDFWASWCSPCVNEQPKLAELYKNYRNSEFTSENGFEIFGVSLDNKKKAWQAIIKKYKINWTQVSDLQFWTSPVAKMYFIQELPYNILIDGNGKIIAKNLHGEELDLAIRNRLKK